MGGCGCVGGCVGGDVWVWGMMCVGCVGGCVWVGDVGVLGMAPCAS